MPEAPDRGYAYLQKTFKELSGIDLALYRDRQMVRRLSAYLRRIGSPSFYALARLIQRDDKALQDLVNYITINVTEFFRNPDRFEYLRDHVLPALAKETDELRIWSAGCATGEEAYTLAILLAELGIHRASILATDIDENVLAVARRGTYSPERMDGVDAARRARFFRRSTDGWWSVNSEVRRYVEFQRHDLLRDPYPGGMHLILCRNVVIYFTDAAKHRLYKGFAKSLVTGGYLLLGGTESILNPAAYGFQAAGPFLYQRVETTYGVSLSGGLNG